MTHFFNTFFLNGFNIGTFPFYKRMKKNFDKMCDGMPKIEMMWTAEVDNRDKLINLCLLNVAKAYVSVKELAIGLLSVTSIWTKIHIWHWYLSRNYIMSGKVQFFLNVKTNQNPSPSSPQLFKKFGYN